MKKEIIKIGIIFFVVVGLIFFGLNYIFFNQSGPKSKAAGETIYLSFNPTSQTAAANKDFTVSLLIKPSINTVLRGYRTKVNFDKTKLKFKSIQYKVGVVSASLGNTNANITEINTRGSIFMVAEVQTATGYTLGAANGAELAIITFTSLGTSGSTVKASDSEFFSSHTDKSLFNSWTVAAQNLDINGGQALTPTPTGGTTGNVKLNLKLKFQGISKLPATGENSMVVKVRVDKEVVSVPVNGTGTFIAGSDGIWTGTVGVNLTAVAGKYKILVKGPQHIQKKICDSAPTETSPGVYRCSDGNITLALGDNNLNFSGILLLSGDLDQSGIVDSVDFGLVKNNLGKTDSSILVKSDLNRDGTVDTQDFSLIIAALGVRTDEQ